MICLQKKLFGAMFAVLFLCEISFFVMSAEKTLQAETAGFERSTAAGVSGSAVNGQPTEGAVSGGAVSDGTVSGQPVSVPGVISQPVPETPAVETAQVETKNTGNPRFITTKYGKIEGKKTKNSYVWLGVPYGQTERWRAPNEPKAWTKTKSCKKKKKAKGDDCLFVNVYKPLQGTEEAKPLPVIVFLHGGGNVGGTANRNFGEFVKETGAIAVSVEFRQGAFGWFCSRGLSSGDSLGKGGNFAMLDIRLALKWVQKNIAAFGGDAGNVTLSGFSAGARDVLNCTISPVMKGLFDKVISFSGGMTTCSIREGRRWSNEKLAQVLVRRGRFSKKKRALKYVKRMSKKKMNKLLNSLTDSEIRRMVENTGLRLTNFPQCFRDGRVIPKSGFDCVEWGGYNRVPMIIGSNNSEFSNVSYQAMHRMVTKRPKMFKNRKQFYNLLKKAKMYGSQLQSSFYLEKVASRYSADPYHQPVYAYRFCWGEDRKVVGADYARYIGAIHGMDVDFLLGRFVKGKAVTSSHIYNKSNAKGRKALASRMRQYIKNFLYTGNPNGTDASGRTLNRWNRWGRAGSKRIMKFSATKKKAKSSMTSRYINRVKCKRRMRRSLSKRTYKFLKQRILNDRFFV